VGRFFCSNNLPVVFIQRKLAICIGLTKLAIQKWANRETENWNLGPLTMVFGKTEYLLNLFGKCFICKISFVCKSSL